MKFTNDDIKHITTVLFNLYSFAKKKKLQNVPKTFEEFLNKNINDELCPKDCKKYVTQ